MKKKEDLPECPIATTVSLVGSKWKLLIIRNLMKRSWRFNELRRSLDGISQKVLTESLRQLTGDGLVFRKDYKTNPPKVEYGMTELGRKFLNVLKSMEEFGRAIPISPLSNKGAQKANFLYWRDRAVF